MSYIVRLSNAQRNAMMLVLVDHHRAVGQLLQREKKRNRRDAEDVIEGLTGMREHIAELLQQVTSAEVAE